MTSISGADIAVTTVGHKSQLEPGASDDSIWIARHGDQTAYFTAPRDAEGWWLLTVGAILLGRPIGTNAADLLTEDRRHAEQ